MLLEAAAAAALAAASVAVAASAALLGQCACLDGGGGRGEEALNEPIMRTSAHQEGQAAPGRAAGQAFAPAANQTRGRAPASPAGAAGVGASAAAPRAQQRGGGPVLIADARRETALQGAAASAAARAQRAGAPAYKTRAAAGANVGVGGAAALPSGADGQQLVIFCRCGGPNSGNVLTLVPCGCRSLCMICAQAADACPTCGAAIEDSLPSFRIAKAK